MVRYPLCCPFRSLLSYSAKDNSFRHFDSSGHMNMSSAVQCAKKISAFVKGECALLPTASTSVKVVLLYRSRQRAGTSRGAGFKRTITSADQWYETMIH